MRHQPDIDFVRALPLPVRIELANVDVDPAEMWLVRWSTSDDVVHLPKNPLAIAEHAAKFVGAVGCTIERFADRRTASVRFRLSDVPPGGKLTVSVHHDNDPTGHLAACLLLAKVMGHA